MSFQRTLKKPVVVTGVGLHSGKEVVLRIKPARPNSGLVFVRTDLPGQPEIPAHFKNVVNTQLATTLGVGSASISTVEHILAALQGLGIDNAVLEVDGEEMPILDGSALPIYEAMLEVGTQAQTLPRVQLVMRKRVELKVKEKWAYAEPSSRLEIHGSFDWDHAAIGVQEYHYIEGKTPFTDIAGARTFGFMRDFESLKRAGLARGASMDNVIVLGESSVMNPDGLRYSNEFARHKVLDALGDLKLSGLCLQGYIRLHRAGHDLHSQLLAEIFNNPDCFEIIGGETQEEVRPAWVRAALIRAGLVASF